MKEKRANQQEKLLRAASELVAEGGVSALRTREIAKRAQVSVGTLHYCFATKAELLQALYRYLLAQFRRSTEHLEHDDKDIRSTLDGQARLRLHLLRSQDTVYLAWRAFAREAWTDPVVAQIVKAHFSEQRSRFEAILADARRNGQLPSEPVIPDSLSAAMIVGLYEGLTVQWTLSPGCLDPDDYVQGLHKLLGLCGPEE